MMRAHALSDALPDFGAAALIPLVTNAPRPQPAPEPRGPFISDSEWQARIEQAVADTEARVSDKLKIEHEDTLEKLTELHKAELETVSQDFAATMGATIAARMDELEQRIVEVTSTAAARLLSGVLSDDLHTRSVERMVEVLNAALDDREAIKITVRGPASLYEPLRKAMGAHAERMRFIEAPGADLSVSLDETVYETRLAEWSGALSQVIA